MTTCALNGGEASFVTKTQWAFRLVTVSIILVLQGTSVWSQLAINEFSNGPNGAKEFYELVVVGSPGSFQDLRGWLIDDHSGFFGCGSGNGIATGHVRLAQHTNWACVPTGSLIVLYNNGDPNPALTLANDPTDANNDRVYILPISSSPYLEMNTGIPSSSSCNAYGGPYGAPTSWIPLALGNGGDAAQTIDPANTAAPYHAVGYGSIGMPLPSVYFSGSGSGDNYSFINATSNDWNLQANWAIGSASTTDSPGQPNSTANQTWLASFELQATTNVTSGCAPLTVNFGSNSNAANHTYSWDFGDNTSGTGVTTTHTYTSTGTFQAVLTVTHANGCIQRDTVTISTTGGGTLTLPTVANQCANASPVSLAGATPAGGMWTGPGVSSGQFDPAIAGVGTHTLVYSVTTTCALSDSLQVQVFPVPAPTFSAPGPFCANAAAVALTGGSPAGGTYSGTGVSSGQFDPAIAGTGTHNVVYSVTNAGGCTGSATQSITVNAVPTATASPSSVTYCSGGAAQTLAMGSPAGGTYSGTGVTGNQFSPTVAGVGTHQVVYTVTSTGCSDTAQIAVTVTANPSPVFPALTAVCVDASPISLTGVGATPTGGTFSGTGVTGTNFSPMVAGVGTHTLTYAISSGGCSGSATQTITVNALPTVTLNPLSSVCQGANPVTLSGGSPAGGTYSGTGVTGNQFDPVAAGVGTHTITYTYTGANTCSATATQNITVTALPTVLFGMLSTLCVTSSPFTLTTGSPVGGTYSGPGVTGNQFDPSVAGLGTHTLNYTVSSGGCSASATQTISVVTSQAITFPPLTAVCVDGASVMLNGATPAGGTYSGPGVTGTTFSPAAAGAGTHTITYTLSSGGCTGSAAQSIAVNALPNVTLAPFSNTCQNAAALTLSGGSPAGGTFSGPGVTGNQFDPVVAGLGTHTITYGYTDGNNCSASATETITVNALPNPTFGAIANTCVNGTPITLTTGSPAGGTYSGPGVSAGQFDPVVAGAGTHTLSYTVTANGCSANATQTVTVQANPTVTFPPVSNACVNGAAFPLGGATPIGGTYSGPGVAAGVFTPATAGVGTHTLTYTWSAAGCTGSATQQVVVFAAPTVTLAPLPGVCEGGAPFTLTGGSPAGGVYGGLGVVGSQFNPAVTGPGNHNVTYTVTDVNNCQGTASQLVQVVPDPVIQWNVPTSLCASNGNVLVNTATPVGGVYSGADLNGDTLLVNQVTGGTTTIQYVVSVSGCTDTTTQTIAVLPDPDAVIQVVGSTSPCEGDTVSLVASGVGNTRWNTGSTAGSLTVTQSGTFVLVDSNACGVDTDTADITFIGQLELALEGLDFICPGEEVELLATTNGALSWSIGATTPAISVRRAGTYRVQATSTCDTLTESITVRRIPRMTLNGVMHPDRNNDFEFTAIPDSLSPYTWYINGSPVWNESNFQFDEAFQSSGDYVVRVEAYSPEGCLLNDTVQVSVERLFSLFVPNAFTPNGDGRNDILQVVGERPREFSALIFNRWGELLYEWYDIDGGWDGTYRGQLCGDGVYVIHVQADGRKIIQGVTLLNR